MSQVVNNTVLTNFSLVGRLDILLAATLFDRRLAELNDKGIVVTEKRPRRVS
jgi:hypothetical protein